MWTSRELVLPRWRQKPYFMAAALVFLSNLSSENLVVLPFWIWIESEAKQAASTGKIMPPVDLATFSAAPLPWAWVPGWILTVVAVSGNTLVIYLIATNRRLQTQVNLFIMSLHGYCWFLLWFNLFPNIFHLRILPAMWSRTPTDLRRLLRFRFVDELVRHDCWPLRCHSDAL